MGVDDKQKSCKQCPAAESEKSNVQTFWYSSWCDPHLAERSGVVLNKIASNPGALDGPASSLPP